MSRCAGKVHGTDLIPCKYPSVVIVDGKFSCPYHVTSMVRDSLMRRAQSMTSEPAIEVDIDPEGAWWGQYQQALDEAEKRYR